EGEYFNDYYDRQGEKYFYTLLKPLANLEILQPADFIDWGQTAMYETEIGVGECASVVIDLVSILIFEADEKADWAKEAFAENRLVDAIYHAYSVMISAAKGLLLDKDVNCSTHHGIISEFDKNYPELSGGQGFKEKIMQINQHEPSYEFAVNYLSEAFDFLEKVKSSPRFANA
ncbi:MAG: HEPN domain-containing protein, partial [Verrucomicrobia bacterium]|nr:HEPN domain-containing protein [Cytophagales bacterium]